MRFSNFLLFSLFAFITLSLNAKTNTADIQQTDENESQVSSNLNIKSETGELETPIIGQQDYRRRCRRHCSYRTHCRRIGRRVRCYRRPYCRWICSPTTGRRRVRVCVRHVRRCYGGRLRRVRSCRRVRGRLYCYWRWQRTHRRCYNRCVRYRYVYRPVPRPAPRPPPVRRRRVRVCARHVRRCSRRRRIRRCRRIGRRVHCYWTYTGGRCYNRCIRWRYVWRPVRRVRVCARHVRRCIRGRRVRRCRRFGRRYRCYWTYVRGRCYNHCIRWRYVWRTTGAAQLAMKAPIDDTAVEQDVGAEEQYET